MNTGPLQISTKIGIDSNPPHELETTVNDFNKKLIDNPSGSINKANELIRDRLIDALGKVFGQDTKIQFSDTSFNRIVENLRLFFYPKINSSTEIFRSLEENSLGYNNLLYLATILAEFKYVADRDDYIKVLLIEEPEAHLHPQLQVRLLKFLEKEASKDKIQIIVTTHSPVLASSVSLDSIIHLSNDTGNAQAVPVYSCGLPDSSKAFVSRWLDATKSNLLFAKGVILVEGIAEALLLPELAKAVLLKYNNGCKEDKEKLPPSLEDSGVSVINLNGIYFGHFMQLFCNLENQDAKFLPVRCAGITDNDPGKKCIPTPSSPPEGKNYIAKKLTPLVNQSAYCRLYKNILKTFEYDLAMEDDNLSLMLPIALNLVKANGRIRRKFESLINVNWSIVKDEVERAKAAFFLLNNIEKGEYAQALAGKLMEDEGFILSVPKYIEDAVLWACGRENG